MVLLQILNMTCFHNIRPASSGFVDSYMLPMMSKSSGGHLIRLYVNLRTSSLTRQFSGFVPNTLKNHSKGIEFLMIKLGELMGFFEKNNGVFQQPVLADRLVVLCNCIPHTVSQAQVRRGLAFDSSSFSEDKHIVQARRLRLLRFAVCKT